MATQPIQPREAAQPPAMLPPEIAAIRVLTEATLWQAIPLQSATIVSLASGEGEASFARFNATANWADPELHGHGIPAAGRRYRETIPPPGRRNRLDSAGGESHFRLRRHRRIRIAAATVRRFRGAARPDSRSTANWA